MFPSYTGVNQNIEDTFKESLRCVEMRTIPAPASIYQILIERRF